MAQRVQEVMTSTPITLPASATVVEAAKKMRDANIGDVIVTRDDGHICGIVTDRDIVVRGLANGKDPRQLKLQDVCSQELTTVSPDDDVRRAIQLMAHKGIRRLPVADQGRPVGIVSLGDLAVERDPKSVLGEISSKPPNR